MTPAIRHRIPTAAQRLLFVSNPNQVIIPPTVTQITFVIKVKMKSDISHFHLLT